MVEWETRNEKKWNEENRISNAKRETHMKIKQNTIDSKLRSKKQNQQQQN